MPVSICLPTYEPNPTHLRAAIDSVLAQTFYDWELIIHDDASTGAAVEEIVTPYLHDKRIRFHRSDVRLGIGGNWNACVRMGEAPLVAFLFQDDLWHPDFLKHSVDVLHKEPDVGFTAANHSYRLESQTGAAATGIYNEVEKIRKELPAGRIRHDEFLKRWIERGLRPNIIGEPSFVVLRRELMLSVGIFREDMKQGLDAEYWVRCLLKSDGWWIREDLGQFRVHAGGTTARNEEAGKGRMDRLRIFRKLITELPPGPMKKLTRKVRRRELVRMVGKFLIRRRK